MLMMSKEELCDVKDRPRGNIVVAFGNQARFTVWFGKEVSV